MPRRRGQPPLSLGRGGMGAVYRTLGPAQGPLALRLSY
jgi:hypothetical protein